MIDANGWPDPARPGVPLNPERHGWHWLAWDPAWPEPAYWDGEWSQSDTSNLSVRTARYLGPLHTPAEVAEREAAAAEAMRAKVQAEERTLARIIVAADLMQQATALGPDWAATMQLGLDRMGLSDALARIEAAADARGMLKALVIAQAVHDRAASCAREPALIANIRREYLAQARGAEDVIDAIRAAAKEVKP